MNALLRFLRAIGRIWRPAPLQLVVPLNRRDYKTALVIEEGSLFSRGGSMHLVAYADLVVNTAGFVLKNRAGQIGFGGQDAVKVAESLPEPTPREKRCPPRSPAHRAPRLPQQRRRSA